MPNLPNPDQRGTTMKLDWWKYLPEQVQNGNEPLTDDDFWEAVAESRGCDPSEIADGDPEEWL